MKSFLELARSEDLYKTANFRQEGGSLRRR